MQGHSSGPQRGQRAKRAGPVVGTWTAPAPSLFLEPGLPQYHPRFQWTGAGACPSTVQVIARPGGLAGLAPGPKCQKVDRFLKNPHEMSIRSTKNADFLPFGYSIEGRLDLEGSWYGPRTPIQVIHEFGADRRRASPVSQKQVGAGPVW